MYFHILPKHNNFCLPTRGFDPETGVMADPEAVGYDLYAPESGFIDALSRKRIPLGFAAAFTPGRMGLLLDRSGMANKGQARLGGVIDPSFRNEWQVILYNTTHEVFRWKAGDRIVQVVFVVVDFPDEGPRIVTKLEESARGEAGFGELTGR